MDNFALARSGHVVRVVALLFAGAAVVVGCGSALKPVGGTGGAGGGGGSTGSGGVGGASACSQSDYPGGICCRPSDHDPLVDPYVCDESTGVWACPLGYVESPPAVCTISTSTGGTLGTGGSGSGGVGGSAGTAGGAGGAGGLSGHSGTNDSCGPSNNGEGGSECGKQGLICCTSGVCDQGLRCISGGTCARACAADGGVSCLSGTTCQTKSACCVGTACAAVQVTVCL